jgi:pantetheine-phosphate adenylyltransferase
MKKVLYAGTFDPITNGHLDLINRASKLCDKLMIGVMENQSKAPFFTAKERSEMIKRCIIHLPNVEVIISDGLLADFVNCNQIEAVIRGLRATMDFEYEMQMAHMNARLYNEDVETIFLMNLNGDQCLQLESSHVIFSWNCKTPRRKL